MEPQHNSEDWQRPEGGHNSESRRNKLRRRTRRRRLKRSPVHYGRGVQRGSHPDHYATRYSASRLQGPRFCPLTTSILFHQPWPFLCFKMPLICEFQVAAAALESDWILCGAAASADIGRAVVANADEAAVAGGREVNSNISLTVLTRAMVGLRGPTATANLPAALHLRFRVRRTFNSTGPQSTLHMTRCCRCLCLHIRT